MTASPALAAPATDSVLRDAYRGRQRRVPVSLLIPLGATIPVVVLALWWILSATGNLNPATFSSPPQVIATLGQLITSGALPKALVVSLGRAGTGLLIGLLVGLSAGTLTGLSRIGESLVDPVAQVLRTIPILALLPLFLAWFGLSELPKVLVIAFAVAAPIYVNTLNGIKHVDKKLVETAKVFELSSARTVFQVILPAALPSIFNGLRLAVSLSVLLLVAAETINAQAGLGFLANQGLSYFRVDIIFAVIIVYGVIGIVGDLLVRGLERVAMPWLGRKGVR